MFLVSLRSCLRSIHWSQVLIWEWRCSWSSADRRCSNYIWVINNFMAYKGATYIGGFTVPYGNIDLAQHWLKWWLVAWWLQAITRANVDLSSVRASDNYLRAISQEIPQPLITKISLKVTYLKFHSNLPGSNELMALLKTAVSSV